MSSSAPNDTEKKERRLSGEQKDDVGDFDSIPKTALPVAMKKTHSSPVKSGTRKLELSAITDFENESDESESEDFGEQVRHQKVRIQLLELP